MRAWVEYTRGMYGVGDIVLGEVEFAESTGGPRVRGGFVNVTTDDGVRRWLNADHVFAVTEDAVKEATENAG